MATLCQHFGALSGDGLHCLRARQHFMGKAPIVRLTSEFLFPQMQQQELAQMRQRDANLTALAAIGPRKKRKLDSPGGTAAGTEVGRVLHICCGAAAPRLRC